MRSLILVVAATFAFAAAARTIEGDGHSTTQTRDVAPFDAIKVQAPADVVVHVGPALKVTVTGDENLLPHLRTDVRSGALEIETDPDLRSKTPLRVEISVPQLRRVDVNGSGDVSVDGGRGDTDLAIAGSGDVRWAGEGAKVTTTIAGSGDVTLQGSAAELVVRVSGSGEVQAKQLKARDVDVKIQGSGDVRVHLDGGRLRAVVNGSGDVDWSGSGSVEKAQASGSGHIRKS